MTVTIMEKLNIATQRATKDLLGAFRSFRSFRVGVPVKTPELIDLAIPLQYPEIPASPPYNVLHDLH